MREFAPSMPERTGVKALVKWFNPTKGFGFVQFDDGSPDAFLHVSVIERLGHSDLPEGTEVICDLAQGRKGLQVHQITSIEHLPESRPGGGFGGGGGGYDGGGYGGGGGFYGDRPRRPAPPPAGPPVEGTVKFFNAEKASASWSPTMELRTSSSLRAHCSPAAWRFWNPIRGSA